MQAARPHGLQEFGLGGGIGHNYLHPIEGRHQDCRGASELRMICNNDDFAPGAHDGAFCQSFGQILIGQTVFQADRARPNENFIRADFGLGVPLMK